VSEIRSVGCPVLCPLSGEGWEHGLDFSRDVDPLHDFDPALGLLSSVEKENCEAIGDMDCGKGQ
jgi:hypothetical protein